MKRLITLIGIACLLIGIRLYDDGIYRFCTGELVVYDSFDTQHIFDKEYFLPTGADCYRIDTDRSFDVDGFLADCKAVIVFAEEEQSLIYAYSPMIQRSVWLFGKRVNMMIHSGKEKINIGVPILKGSY